MKGPYRRGTGRTEGAVQDSGRASGLNLSWVLRLCEKGRIVAAHEWFFFFLRKKFSKQCLRVVPARLSFYRLLSQNMRVSANDIYRSFLSVQNFFLFSTYLFGYLIFIYLFI